MRRLKEIKDAISKGMTWLKANMYHVRRLKEIGKSTTSKRVASHLSELIK